jgi:hypothetical protein
MSYDGYHSICQQTHRECFLDVFGEHPAVYVVLCGDRRSRGIGVHVLVRVCHTSVLALFNNGIANFVVVCGDRLSVCAVRMRVCLQNVVGLFKGNAKSDLDCGGLHCVCLLRMFVF